ncbi:MAG: phosphatidylglycerophosphatase A [Candidatus Tectomicrobia bacterium]|nr:phosphatidylglycerophosphatase A [Candidatus Tectomicrobia bacterium]MBI3026299.1 phosphatidylglycerophosphatase A [Candidatus Tectomicrobia bacterium]
MRFSAAWALATLCGLGRAPLAPGTAGSLAGAAVYWAAWRAGSWVPFVLFALAVAGGIWSAGKVERALGRKDPPEVVVDELAGQLFCLLGWEPTLTLLGAGFVVFRALDIVKPWRWLESLPGGWGVMADDLAAGAAGWVLLAIGRSAGFF